MLALNKNDLILQINNKMSLLGGKDKKLSSSSLDKSIIPKKSNKKQQEYMDTNPTTYDEYSYEITPQYYSSSQTISSKSFEAIYKKYYTWSQDTSIIPKPIKTIPIIPILLIWNWFVYIL